VLRLVRWLLLLAVALVGAAVLLLFLVQRRILYVPDRYPEEAALRAAARLGLEPWRDGRGALLGWRAPPLGRARARVVVLHGNGGSALDRTCYAAALARRGLEVILLEYPGYGPRPGEPTLHSLSAAATDALDQLSREGAAPIWVLGESLGSGVAGRAVALRPGLVKGLVLVTPFARLLGVARRHVRWVPEFFLRDPWAPEDDLAGWAGPTWVLLAGQDRTVGLHEGLRLADGLAGPKRVQIQEQAGHNDLALGPDEPYWDELVAFLEGGGRAGR
jgi:pimeloyl-ACP methyl ester carboxylesterase